MKLRLLAMATVAAAALSTPAMAGDGWYLGLGGGWDNQTGIRGTSVPAPAIFNRQDQLQRRRHRRGRRSATNGPTRLAPGKRVCFHPARHLSIDRRHRAATRSRPTWSISLTTIPLSDTVEVHGRRRSRRRRRPRRAARQRHHLRHLPRRPQRLPVAGDCRPGGQRVAPDVDLFGEYRYRENETDDNFASSYTDSYSHPCLHHLGECGDGRPALVPDASARRRRRLRRRLRLRLRLRLRRRLPRRLRLRRRRRRTSSSSTSISRTSPRKRRARSPKRFPQPRRWARSASWSPATPTRSVRTATTRRFRSAAPTP